MNKAKELREMRSEELNSKLWETKEKLFQLGFQHRAARTLKNTLQIRTLRRVVARIKTILNEQSKKEKK
ncbi:MAG: 50S ribosomal protein L29 [Elusimicrobiota bacterium]